jgi:hypothetical protein
LGARAGNVVVVLGARGAGATPHQTRGSAARAGW